MDLQQALTTAFGIIVLLIGVPVKMLWSLFGGLQSSHNKLASKTNDLEVTISRDFVPKDDFRDITDRLFKKLDDIADKIDRKADKK